MDLIEVDVVGIEFAKALIHPIVEVRRDVAVTSIVEVGLRGDDELLPSVFQCLAEVGL